MQANYHTHTKWCHHGSGEIEDFIIEAMRVGLKEIAITEHVPLPDNLDYNRMAWEDFPDYDRSFEKAIAKYGNEIKIIKGFECEYYPEQLTSYEKFQKEYGYELLILAQHTAGKNREIDSFAPKSSADLLVYAEDVCHGIQTGMFRFLAHPDVALLNYNNDVWDQTSEDAMGKIFRCCEEHFVPVEINANGLRRGRRYPDINAFTLSKNYHLQYLISSDAHHPQLLYDEAIQRAESFAFVLNLPVLELLQL